jgi:hypothetical protein
MVMAHYAVLGYSVLGLLDISQELVDALCGLQFNSDRNANGVGDR